MSALGCQVATCFGGPFQRGVMFGGSGVSIGGGDGVLGSQIKILRNFPTISNYMENQWISDMFRLLFFRRAGGNIQSLNHFYSSSHNKKAAPL